MKVDRIFKYQHFKNVPQINRESYSLLRAFFRLKYKLPFPMQEKYIYNVKESFSVVDLFGTEAEKQTILNQVKKHDLAFVTKLAELPEDLKLLLDKRFYNPDLFKRPEGEE
ncbi:hypothetical protein ABK040_011368 [Willaertia magna]